MATTDELLEQAQTLMDKPTTDEEYLNIDWNTRLITVPSSLTNIGVYNDKDTNRLYFRCPIEYGEFKIADFGLRVNYQNTGVSTTKHDGDVYFIDDVESDGDYLTFSWLVGRHAYLEEGTTAFIVCCKVIDSDDNVVNELNTTIAILDVLEGLEVDVLPPEDYPDYLEEILKRCEAAEETASDAKETADSIKDSIPTKTSELENDSGYITDADLGDYATKEAVETAQSTADSALEKAEEVEGEIPTKVSELENDIPYATQEALEAVEESAITGINVNGIPAEVADHVAEIITSGGGGVYYGINDSSQSSSTVKSITCPDLTELTNGTAIYVDMDVGSVADAPQLNVNNTGAYPIQVDFQSASATNIWRCGEGAYILFVFARDMWFPIGTKDTYYGTCTTAAGTQNKQVSFYGFVLQRGVEITVLFSNANTADSPQLVVGGCGALPIVGDWNAGDYVTFTFDGSSYIVQSSGSEAPIEHISVNGTEQPIEDKTVDITVPTKVAQLEDEAEYARSYEIANLSDNQANTDHCVSYYSKTVITGITLNGADVPIERSGDVWTGDLSAIAGITFDDVSNGSDGIKALTVDGDLFEYVDEICDTIGVYFMRATSDTPNIPETAAFFIMLLRNSNTQATMIAFRAGSNTNTYMCKEQSSSWGDWTQIIGGSEPTVDGETLVF